MAIRFLLNEKLGEEIQKRGQRISLSQISRETGISKNALSNMGGAGISRINFSTLDALCRFFDCQPGDLLEYQSNHK